MDEDLRRLEKDVESLRSEQDTLFREQRAAKAAMSRSVDFAFKGAMILAAIVFILRTMS